MVFVISTHTPLARRDQGESINGTPLRGISTHTPLARRDHQGYNVEPHPKDFYSHASCEARQLEPRWCDVIIEFLLTRLLRGATTAIPDLNVCTYISTHTPLARRDWLWDVICNPKNDFYSHASCEARQDIRKRKNESWNFYSHASCEARRVPVPAVAHED